LVVVIALPLADWSPVVVVLELDCDWLPVVVVVLLLSDWSPVDVVLSIVRLERPFSVMSGLKVEVDPLTELLTSEVEPVIDEVWLEVEPLTEGFAVAVEAVVEPVVGAVAEPEAEPLRVVLEVVAACSSGMQSWCTGLAECSFAWPVSLFASLPACGFLKLLQSGVVLVLAVLFVPLIAVRGAVAVALLVALDFVSGAVVLLVAAMAGVSAPMTAAARMLRVREMVLMRPPSIVGNRTTSFATGVRQGCCARGSRFQARPTRASGHRHNPCVEGQGPVGRRRPPFGRVSTATDPRLLAARQPRGMWENSYS
jgi:hypothetical protein